MLDDGFTRGDAAPMNRDFNLPPGLTRREVNSVFDEPEEIICRVCGEWFVPINDMATCDSCLDELYYEGCARTFGKVIKGLNNL
jgi:hypothetical protein